MGMKMKGALEGAKAGASVGGPVGGVVGGALGYMQGENGQGQQTLDSMMSAMQSGQQDLADMRNGITMDDSDKRAIMDSVDAGYGIYGGY